MSIQSAGPLSQPVLTAVETRSPAERVERVRNQRPLQSTDVSFPQKIQSEELLETIKELTENGTYQVRFEMDTPTNRLVISLIDAESGEKIRQFPSEELLGTIRVLNDLRGNIVDSQS
jgi:flagellar protein FlaG